jgi:hypothetical protein
MTDRRVFEITSPSYPLSQPSSASPIHLYVKKNWVAWKTDNILWLPPDYRARCTFIRNNALVSGLASGRVIFIEFDLPNMPATEEASDNTRHILCSEMATEKE